MQFFRSFQRITFLLVFSVGIAITYAAYVAISNIAAEQSRIQQQSVSPVFSLVNEELLKPLHIAETIGHAKYFNKILDSDDLEQEKLVSLLNQLEQQFDLTFFAASEKARKQYLSNGRQIDLIEGKVFWYFEAMEVEADLFADLGQVGDVHLYFDIKIYNEEKEFLGIVGVGKSLKEFIAKFDEYKSRYGYDFLFVNDKSEIILTSLSDLVVTDAHIPSLDSLSWFRHLQASGNTELNNRLVTDRGEDYLISQINIDELNWQLLLLIPLQARQAQITKSFVTNTAIAISLVLTFFALMFWVMMYYKHSLEKSIDIDPLSQLPNRTYVNRRFQQLRRQNADVSVIMVDIDRFKNINDSYGHNMGDAVIKKVSQILAEEVRQQDLVGRWGGEEFIMLVPCSNHDVAKAIAERSRKRLEREDFGSDDQKITVTASFGYTHGPTNIPLSELLANADGALYQAKKQGRNQVAFFDTVPK